MAARELRPSDVPGGSPPASGSVSEALANFQPIRNRALRRSLRVLPLFLVSAIAVDLTIGDSTKVMFISGMVAATLSACAFQALLQRIPDTLDELWRRYIIADRGAADSGSLVETERAHDPAPIQANQGQLNDKYCRLISDIEALLNSPLQWAVGVAFILLVFTWLLYVVFRNIARDTSSPFDYLFTAFISVVESCAGFIMGTIAWRMLVTGIAVWKLGRQFNLRPKLGHPDRCGGLSPLGNLCLWNALIVSIAGLYLGGWIILRIILRPSTPYHDLAESYARLFSGLLIVPIAVAVISFFLPLWSAHQVMVCEWEVVRRHLDELGQSIDRRTRELLDRADELEPAEGEKLAKKLDFLKVTYDQNNHFPVWPFNVQILMTFVTSQAVPVLGLIVNVIDALTKILKHQG